MTVDIYNPQWDYTKWSAYSNLHSIALMYRRVGDADWSHALDAANNLIFFQYIVPAVRMHARCA